MTRRPDDQELFERLRAGSQEAFELLFRAHYPGLLRFACAQLRNRTDAEDAVHDVFLRIWRDRERLVDPGSVRAYLLAAMRNRVIDLLRRRTLQSRWMEPMTDGEDGRIDDRPQGLSAYDPAGSESDAASLAELDAAIRDAVARLPERCRTVFILCREEQLSYAEAAEVMGVSVSTVKTQMARALASLRSALGPYLPFIAVIYLASH